MDTWRDLRGKHVVTGALDAATASSEEHRLAKTGRTRVLVVDDEPTLRRTVARMLSARGMDVLIAEDGLEALSQLEHERADVALIDLMMPNMDGLELLSRIKQRHSHMEVIIMTAFGDVETAVKAVRAGAYHFLTKPFRSNDEVALTVAKAAERQQLLDRAAMLERRLEERRNLGEFIGTSTAMQQVYHLLKSVAPTSSTVLILGESGTGKELTARAIHEESRRASKPFVAVNCSAIPVELVESELFGHMRGAFTGATRTREGLFEAAHGGTLFLDEIGDLPPMAQVKLLRALQEGEIKRVGANESRTLDVRVIAATNVDLKSRVAAGRFREDLYYRLNVVAIELPPLRQRPDDIPLLAYHFLRKYAARAHRDVNRISEAAMEGLCGYAWPGNVRELQNALERAVVLSDGNVITTTELPFTALAAPESPAAVAPEPAGFALELPTNLSELPYKDAKQNAVTAFDTAYFKAVLSRTGGNISEAARRAGLDRSNFRRAVKKAGLD